MQLTEKKKIKIDSECKEYPIYLTWLNKLGGYSYWLFFKQHEINTSTKGENNYTVSIQDLESANSTNEITGKSATHSLVVGARVKTEDMDGITGLYESPKVMRLMNPETWKNAGDYGVPDPIWQRVGIKDGSLMILRTGSEYLDVKLTIELAFINSQTE